MTGTITLTTDLVNKRIGVTLGSWAAADGPVIVKRVHADTSEWAVRGFTSTSGGAAFAYDYEAPFNQAVTYYAFDGGTKVTSASASLAISTALLRSPGLPANDAPFTLLAKPDVRYPRPSVVLEPLGRKVPIVLTTARQAARFDVKIETHSDGEAAALVNTVTQSAVCLLLIPNTRQSWQYVQVGELTETPFTPFLSTADGDPGSWAQWNLPCTVVDMPVGGVFGDPTENYGLLPTTWATYAAMRTAKPTYLSLLVSIP